MQIVLAPEISIGRGTGHLRRALRLMAHIKNSLLFFPAGRDVNPGYTDLLKDVPEDRITRVVPEADLVVLDRFRLEESDVRVWGRTITVGIDARGSGRGLCSFLVDVLPRLTPEMCNASGIDYLDLPETSERSGVPSGSVLISFGGEDRAGLSERCVSAVLEAGADPSLVSVIRPRARQLKPVDSQVTVLEPVDELISLLGEFDLVITMFGLTAFEARAAGCRVVTVNPTRYHHRLAKAAGFTRAGMGTPSVRRLRAARESASPDEPRLPATRGGSAKLARCVTGLRADSTGCPAHPHARGRARWRDRERTFFTCPECGLLYQERFAPDREEYGPGYFDQEYREHYGRTYLEDFESIREIGRRRSLRIKGFSRGRQLLDIGCAYGPFLAAASELGYEPYGLDVSQEATEYVRGSLGLPCHTGSVLHFDPSDAFGIDSFDVVSLWYVIEHFSNLSEVLTRLSRWVKPGGVLAMSTPYARGITGRSDPEKLLRDNPRDHHSIWDRRSARVLLAEYGFDVKQFVSTGHHPERYPLVSRGLIPAWPARLHSKIFAWGDTFEIYAVRR